MFIQQLYTNCLAHAAYYIESAGEVAIIDPLRDLDQYTSLAKERGATIKYILETHFHADFVSGHIDLADKTGAVIVFGPGATPGYKAKIADDGEVLPLGNVHIKVLHTPGHTVESSCYLLVDEQKKEVAVFTGDTLFVGEVGRPDLLSGNLGKEELAAMLYDSLQHKIKTLPGIVTVYPGHGPGSACGKNIGAEKYSTIGEQMMNNYALLEADKDAFIKVVTHDLPVAPAYFFKDAAINKNGASPMDAVVAKSLNPLSVNVFEKLRNDGFTVLDTRAPNEFHNGYIPGAINIGLNGDFAVWVGTILSIETPLLLVCDPGKEQEAITRLARIGYDNATGYLDGGLDAWIGAGNTPDQVTCVSATAFNNMVDVEAFELLDVRNRREVAKNRVPGALHVPLNTLPMSLNRIDATKNWLVYCAGGYRSMIAASLLKANGYAQVMSLEGGINSLLQQLPELVDAELEEQE